MELIAVLVAVATFVLVVLIQRQVDRYLQRPEAQLDARIRELKQDAQQASVSVQAFRDRMRQKQGRRRSPFAFLRPQRDGAELQTRLVRAGIYYPWAETAFTAIRITAVAAPLITGFICDQMLVSKPPLGLCVGAAAGCMGLLLPSMWLERRTRRRHAVLSSSLPDFLDLLVACIESGLSIEAALQRVTDELQLAHPLLAGELQAVQAQVELGVTPEVAMRNFAERSGFEPLRSLSTVVQQARKFGAGIAEALRQHADGLRQQRELLAEERAQKASVQILVPTMLLIFPAIFVVLAGPAVLKLSDMFAQDKAAAPARRSH